MSIEQELNNVETLPETPVGVEEIVTEDKLESYDPTADVSALIEGEDLSEEFKTKAATIFEAAVVARVKSEFAKLEENFVESVDEAVTQKLEGIYEKVDGYLDYCVEQWMVDNEVALERGIKIDITENFINGLKNLFAESYIDVPAEKLDLVSDLTEEVATLKNQLTEAMEKSIAVNKQLNQINIDKLVMENTAGLTDIDVEKFKDLSKELVFEDVETYSTKLKVIRESYFKAVKTQNLDAIVSDVQSDILSEDVKKQQSTNPTIAGYASALDKLF